MARSYRKYPFISDKGRGTWKEKREAAKAVRNEPEVDDGGSFKKVSNSYNIQDWCSLYTSYERFLIVMRERCPNFSAEKVAKIWRDYTCK